MRKSRSRAGVIVQTRQANLVVSGLVVQNLLSSKTGLPHLVLIYCFLAVIRSSGTLDEGRVSGQSGCQ